MKIVAFGGGTGLSTLLRGIKLFSDLETTAVVTVMDEGGSSGLIRRELGVLPPGDIRNNIVALAEDESLMATMMTYRFTQGKRLKDQSLGNLIIAALTKITGSFPVAVEKISSILAIKGQVIPVTEESTRLVAVMEDGEIVTGESEIASRNSRITSISLDRQARPFERVMDEITKSDVVVLGPGSLFTSIIPNLLVDGISGALREKPKILVSNLMTQPGETIGMSMVEHVKTIERYLGSKIDKVVINSEEIPEEIFQRYKAQGADPIYYEDGDSRFANFRLVKIVVDPRDGKEKIRHDPIRLAAAVRQIALELAGD